MLPWAHPSPNPKWDLDQFSVFAQLTAGSCYILQWSTLFPLKIAPSHGGSEPPFNTWFLGPIRALNPNRISIGSTILHNLRPSISILYNVTPFPPQNCPFPWGTWTPSNTCFFRPIRAHNPYGISVGTSVFTQVVPVLYSRLPHPQNCPLPWGIWTPSNTWLRLPE